MQKSHQQFSTPRIPSKYQTQVKTKNFFKKSKKGKLSESALLCEVRFWEFCVEVQKLYTCPIFKYDPMSRMKILGEANYN